MNYTFKRAHFLWAFVFCGATELHALKLTRVILASDANPEYLQFWPVVAKTWRTLIGIQPTLALIAHNNVVVDESFGDVIRFAPIPGVSTALYAQCIRLLLPALFPEDVCIISDMDILPLQREYFMNPIKNISDDNFVVYRTSALLKFKQYPMCYVAAKGSLYQEVFNVRNVEDIFATIRGWGSLKLGWSTDQQLLYSYLHKWKHFATHCNLLDVPINRIDRSKNSRYSVSQLLRGAYTDYHCPRPYAKFKKTIDGIIAKVLMGKQARKLRRHKK